MPPPSNKGHPVNNPAPQQPGSGDASWANWATNVAILGALVLALFLIFHFRPFGLPDPTEHKAVGRPLPLVQLEPLTGAAEPVSRDNLSGKVVLIAFWGPWCPPCFDELPHLAALAERFRDRADFQLLAVSCSQATSRNVTGLRKETIVRLRQLDLERLETDTNTVMRELKLDIPTYSDPTGQTQSTFSGIAGLRDLPTTYAVDRQGIIRGVWEGFRPGLEKEIGQLVTELLEESE